VTAVIGRRFACVIRTTYKWWIEVCANGKQEVATGCFHRWSGHELTPLHRPIYLPFSLSHSLSLSLPLPRCFSLCLTLQPPFFLPVPPSLPPSPGLRLRYRLAFSFARDRFFWALLSRCVSSPRFLSRSARLSFVRFSLALAVSVSPALARSRLPLDPRRTLGAQVRRVRGRVERTEVSPRRRRRRRRRRGGRGGGGGE